MPKQFTPRPFKAPNNVNILKTIRRNASSQYRERVQPATQANMAQTMAEIMDFQPNRNEFMDALVNRIGLVIARNRSWDNPLAKFKRGMMNFGESIEEVQTGLLESHIYDPQREYLERDLFGVETPDAKSAFHKINREEFYRVTINDQILKRAFLEEEGLSGYIAQLMSAPATSDAWDEFLMTCQLFRNYYDAGGFFKVQVPNIIGLDSDAADAQQTLRIIRGFIDNLPFLSTRYNAARMPVFASPDELELFISPEANSALDVNALAAAFNIDRQKVNTRQTIIPQEYFNITGAQAILTTRDFFVIADTVYQTTSQPNAAGLTTNYFLHHHEILSASPFVPAVLFTTEPGDPIVINDPVVNSVQPITVKDRAGTTVTDLARGDMYYVASGLNTTPEGSNEGVVLTMSGSNSPFTRLDNNGGLLIGADETAEAIALTSTPSSDYIDSDNATNVAPAKLAVTLSGDVARFWPNPGVLDESDVEGDGNGQALRVMSLSTPDDADTSDDDGTPDGDELTDGNEPTDDAPAGNATRDAWATYAASKGAPESETGDGPDSLSRDALREKYGTVTE
ncbi:major capsid protein [Curtobacterium phage Pize]|uniref:major capsid protein n=1 Tax=Curtobacterium phage Pize TaxID=2851068 RepID=UPI0022000743|nr:major capsid protein [Curtobacterium phage Pize]QXG07738.1 major capsid protein [Curtobacterium phage Pize]